MFQFDLASILTAVFTVLLCLLASLDMWHQYSFQAQKYISDQYTRAARHSSEQWLFSYRLEELEEKLSTERNRTTDVLNSLGSGTYSQLRWNRLSSNLKEDGFVSNRDLRTQLDSLVHNLSSVYSIRCETGGNLLRVGVNNFRTDPRDECQVFTSVSSDEGGPQACFELVPLTEGAFALKSMATGNYLKAMGPGDGRMSSPWKLVVGGPLIGFSERFRVTDSGHLYSALMGQL